MFEKFTDSARRVIVLAQEEARMLNHNYIGTEHILLGLVHEGEGLAAKALESLEISLEGVRERVEEIIGRGKHAPSGHIPFTPRAKKVLELSLREAKQLGHTYISTEHVLLGLVREGEGVAAQVLVGLGADLNRVRQAVIQLLAAGEGEEPGEVRRRSGLTRREEIAGRLDAIEERLAAVERRLGIGPEQAPPELRELDKQLAVLREEKEAAIEAQDFGKAAALRDKERQLLGEREEKERELTSAAGGRESAGAAAETGTGAGPDEVGRLRAEVDRLQAMLREHGIDPGESAATG